VKERIYRYLLQSGEGVPAGRILSDVLNIQSPNTRSSESVLAGILGQDPRFEFTQGLWRLSRRSKEQTRFDFSQTVILHLLNPDRSGTLRGLRGAVRWTDGRIQEFVIPESMDVLGSIRSEIDGHLLIVWSNWELRLWNGLLRSMGLAEWQGETLYLRNLAARVLQRSSSKLRPADLASELALSPVDEERLHEVIRYLNECWEILLDRIPNDFCRDLDSIREWMDGPRPDVDFTQFDFGPDFLHQLPASSGVYIMKDCGGTILYVGKSRNLKRRVSSYFNPRALSHPKIARIHKQLHSIEVHRTDNEVEALLMEMRLIQDFRPLINLQTEIHQQKENRHEGRNLLLFAVDAEHNGVKIYFFRDGIFAGRQSASLGRASSKRLQEKIKAQFFAPERRRKQSGKAWEREVVSRWLASNQRRMNYLDIDEAGNLVGVLKRLQHYLRDPHKLAYKVYYR